jgi:CRP-like cAMP-binding protein
MKGWSKVRALREIPLLSGCTTAELRFVGRLADEVRVPAGTVLAVQDRRSRQFIVVAEGTAGIWCDGRRIGAITRHAWFGEREMLTREVSPVNVVVETSLDAFVWDRRAFASMIDRAPTVAHHLMRALAHLTPAGGHIELASPRRVGRLSKVAGLLTGPPVGGETATGVALSPP